MATDATGTPTSPDSLAKLSSSDAPRITSSGGINAIVDTIQTALNTKMKVTGAPTSNQVPVWNGSAWVPSLLSSSNLTAGTLALTTFTANSNADLTLTTSLVDVPNATLTLGAATTYLVLGVAVATDTTTGWTSATIRLLVNGAAQSGDLLTIDPGSSGTAMQTVAKSWVVTTGGAGQIAKFQAQKAGAGGVVTLSNGNVGIMAIKLTTP